MNNEKKKLREQIKRSFAAHSAAEITNKSARLYDYLFEWPCWKDAETVAVTMSTQNEVNTKPIIEKGWLLNKKMLIPRADLPNRQLHFYEITSFDQTQEEFAGIFEPDPDKTIFRQGTEADLIIVPGLAFNQEKYRLGFGGGYYDRFLPETNAVTCGLALHFQICRLPLEAHDVPLNAIITESGII
ncbi:5-formyltetrahydrofolate cyclo-ligase [Alteribacillus sp. HJP-4]|uniref:5-formyltetrahydrofolate cyclo-ligase n=1 Tax=Alteribacillus sp. HJP-4 TaxID=2775394 RepID=UPI0035CCE840